MYILHGKLKRLNAELRSFNKAHFRNIFAKIEAKRKELVDTQVLILNSSSNVSLVERKRSFTKKLSDILKAE